MEDFSGASHDVVIIAFFRGCKIDLINRGTVFHALVNPKGKDVLFANPRVGKYGGFCFLLAELRVFRSRGSGCQRDGGAASDHKNRSGSRNGDHLRV